VSLRLAISVSFYANGSQTAAFNSLCCARGSQNRPGFFDEHRASKDYDGCDDADGFERTRVTLLEEPLRFLDSAKN
jgi:hypothetical protein